MNQDVAIKVDNVSKTFKLPHEKTSSIKGALINLGKGKKGYETQEALKNISFEVKKGEFFGIVGKNGSGKSTLLKLISEIYTPDTGLITVNGKLTPFIELGVGFNPELSGRDNVFLNGALLGFGRSQMEEMYDEIVEFAELERFMDQKLKNYSSGMQVRLAFSIAIQANSDILVLDEVLAVGDAAFQQKCNNYFDKLKSNGKTVILVTHAMDSVKRFCTRAAYIVNGKIEGIGDPMDIAASYTEANIDKSVFASDSANSSNASTLSAKIKSQKNNKVTVAFTFQSNNECEMYVGISVIYSGIAIADITTSLDTPLLSSGKLEYTLDTSVFNEGVYQITASLFKKKNRECIAISKNQNIFTIKNKDITRGNALKLADTWKYK